MHAIEDKREELEKKRRKEELKKDPDAIIKQYRAAHFICHPRCGFVVDRRDEASIIQHKSQCGYCIEDREQHEKELQFKREGIQKMGYCLGMIERAKQDIKNLNRKIDLEKKRNRTTMNS